MAESFWGWVISAVAALFGVAMGIINALMRRSVSRIDKDMEAHSDRLNEHDKRINTHGSDLLHFKTHVSENYAKETTMQNSLARIHDRIDRLPRDIIDLIRTEK